MSILPTELPSSVGQVSSAWLADEEIRRIRSFRALRRRTSSFSSLSTVSEDDVPHYDASRRGSAPEWDHINRLLMARRSSQTLSDMEWTNSGRRGSFPLIKPGWENNQLLPFGLAKHLLERENSRLTLRRQSLPNEVKWGESTMTMDGTNSMGGTLNGRQLKFKVILLGDCGVGKSSFLQTLLNGKYTVPAPNTNLTMANVVRTVSYNGLDVELHFIDTAGQERYRSITASYYRHSQGCLVFFNVNNKLSFDNVESWIDDLSKYCKLESMAVILVGLTHKNFQRHRQDNKQGSKENLIADSTGSQISWSYDSCCKRTVPRAQAEHLANRCSIPYIEVDIRNNPSSVSDTIYKLLDLLMHIAVQHNEKLVSIKPNSSTPHTLCCSYC